MKNMSFALTVEQFRNETKTVTRRIGWNSLKPGDILYGVKKAMGLKKGEKIEKMGKIKILSVRKESILAISKSDVAKEGFPEWSRKKFIALIMNCYKLNLNSTINRIEFEYI